MSAGIPAINQALLWHALQHFGAKTVFYQVVESYNQKLWMSL